MKTQCCREAFEYSKMSTTILQVMNLAAVNPQVKTMEYAVRGPIVIRAVELEKELAAGVSKPFR